MMTTLTEGIKSSINETMWSDFFPVEEIFTSIQGEGRNRGKVCTFIRLYGCNLSCKYCDTGYSSVERKKPLYTPMTIDDIIHKLTVFSSSSGLICITGGEPLLYPGIDKLFRAVYDAYAVYNKNTLLEIETNGSLLPPIQFRGLRYIYDIKTPSSGCNTRNNVDLFKVITSNDDVVMVISDREDYEFAKQALSRLRINMSGYGYASGDFPEPQIFFSPVCNKEGEFESAYNLVSWMIGDRITDVTMQVQLHKIVGVK